MEQQLAELRSRLAEEQRLRVEEQRLRVEEQRLRVEEQRLRAEDQRKFKEAEARADKEQRLREDEQRKSKEFKARADKEKQRADKEKQRADKEQERREEVETVIQPLNIVEYLESCHSLSFALKIITDKSLTTQGATTNPFGRPFPQRIIPWADFPAQQEKIWEKLLISEHFNSLHVYPSIHQQDLLSKFMKPIASEVELRHFARDTVENPVQCLIEEIYKDEQLREQLQLRGTMKFDSHTNLEQSINPEIEEALEDMSISEPDISRASTPPNTRGASWRRRVGSADQFCIIEQSDGKMAPVVSIEYKAPHKFPSAQIIAGLRGEIRPGEEVINKEGDSPEFLSKSLVAAVITQLFSYMIAKGVRYGYVYDGEAIIFLTIPDDPSIVYYHFSIPQLDFQEDDENRLHRTSVAQILAFILSALAAEPPGQAWQRATTELETWAVEYIDILKMIPETERKGNPTRDSPYNASRWKGFIRSPIRTRARSRLTCKPVDVQAPDKSSEDDDDDTPHTPTPKTTRRGIGQRKATSGQRQGVIKGQNKSNTTEKDEVEAVSITRIEDQPYCTQKCLLGLAFGRALDKQCPNLRDHRKKHIQKSTFLRRIRIQLAEDCDDAAGCIPLYIKGSRGALFKIRLYPYGYTLVAKGMEKHDRNHLLQESKVYHQLRPIQGDYIPVCLGISDLKIPYYYDCGVYTTMLFLSWAGRPLSQYLNPQNETDMFEQATVALKALHNLQVLHKDAEPRNMLWDEHRNTLMIIDLERAEIRARLPLSNISPNRKRNYQQGTKTVVKDDDFDREIRSATRYIRAMASGSW